MLKWIIKLLFLDDLKLVKEKGRFTAHNDLYLISTKKTDKKVTLLQVVEIYCKTKNDNRFLLKQIYEVIKNKFLDTTKEILFRFY